MAKWFKREVSELENLQNVVSDLWKDRYGVRPRNFTAEEWSSRKYLQWVYDGLVQDNILDPPE